MSPESTVEMGKVGEAHFEGNIGDPSILMIVVTQEQRRPFKAHLKNMLREGLTGWLQ